MLLYLTFVITLNLCVGYFLGVYCGALPVLERPIRRDELDEAPLVQPATAAPQEPSSADSTISDKLPGISESDIMFGLAAFQDQLAEIGEELKQSQEAPEEFDTHAKSLQDANHAYLETAHHQVEQLDPESETHRTVVAGIEEVDKASHAFDEIMEEDLAEQANRTLLVEKTDELVEKVDAAKQELNEQVEDLKGQRDAATGLATIDGLLAQIESVLEENGEEQLRTAALVRTEPIDGEPGLASGIHQRVAELVSQSLGEESQAAILDDGQYLLLMEEADLEAITEQIDKLRQEIAATTFVKGDQQLCATVTCAVADLPGAESRQDVVARLEEALAESLQFGTNRTYHHDGSFPTAIDPIDSEIEARTVEV